MSVLGSSLKSSLDKITLFEQGRYAADPEDLAKEIRLRKKQACCSSFGSMAYAERLSAISDGLTLLDQAVLLDQALLSQKKAPSKYEILINRVFDFSNYLFWTIPSNAYQRVASSLTGKQWRRADPADQGPKREVSLTAVFRQLFSYEKNKGYFKVFSLEGDEKPPYEPSDLDQVVAEINALAQLLRFKLCDFVVLNRLTFRVVQLQLHHSNFASARLDQVRSVMAKLLENIVKEMKSSSFFQEGVEDQEHLKRIVTLLSSEEISKLSQEKFEKLSHFDCTSVPIANDSMNNSSNLDKTRDSITHAKHQLKAIASQVQTLLWEILKKHQLRVNDNGWTNRERGIPNFLNWTYAPNLSLEERLTSVLSGLIVVEYLKKHEAKLNDFARNLFDDECEQLERNAYLQLQNRALANRDTTPPTPTRTEPNKIKEAAIEAVIEELLHLSLASITTLVRPNPKYIADQMVSSFFTLAHRALDPKQESQFLRILAISSRSLLQLHMTAGPTSLLVIGKDFVKSALIRCGISTVFDHATTKPSQELQDVLGGLIHTGLAKDDRHFVSAGLFLLTSQINDFLQEKVDELNSAGYRESAMWMSRIAKALKTDLSVNAALTDTITSRRRALEDKKQSKPESSEEEPEVEEKPSTSDCEEESEKLETDETESSSIEEQTSHLMKESDTVPLSYTIEEHHPYNSWLGTRSKKPDYVTVTINGEKNRLPDRKSAEDFVRLMQDQQRFVHQGNEQMRESQQRALYLGQSPSEIPPAQNQDPHCYKVTYDTKKGEMQVFVDGRIEKSTKSAKHAIRYIRDHINGHNSYIQDTVSSYATALTASLPLHITPPENPEHVYHVHKDASGGKNTFTAYASPINGLGAPRNLGEFTNRKEANNWTTMHAGHTAQTHYLKDAMFEAQAAYLESDGSMSDMPPVPDLASHNFRLETSGDQVRLYQNGNRVFKKPLDNHSLQEAFGRASTTIENANRQNRQTANNYIQSLKQKCDNALPIPAVGPSDHKPLQDQLMDINTRNKRSEKQHGFWYQAWRWPFQKADQAAEWLDDHGVVGTLAASKTMPLYSPPKAATPHEESHHRLVLEREELAQMEQRHPAQQVDDRAHPASSDEFHSAAYPMLYPQHAAMHQMQIDPAMIPTTAEPTPDVQEKKGALPMLDKYEDGELAQSNIPAWLRWGANPDRVSLDPKDEIKTQHSQLAALTTSVARFVGGMFDFFTNRDRAINVDINGNPLEVPTLTEKLEDLAERVVPYDRTQPGFGMLQTTSDLVVGGTGAYMMGGPVRRRAPNTSGMGNQAVQEVESVAQRTLQGLADERAFLEEVNQPAYRSGIAGRKTAMKFSGKKVNPSLPIENGGRRIGDFQYTEGAFRHFNRLIAKGIHKGQLERPYMRSLQIIEEIMAAKKPTPDLCGTPGTLRWDVPGSFNGSNGMWELVFHPETNSIYHFQFKSF